MTDDGPMLPDTVAVRHATPRQLAALLNAHVDVAPTGLAAEPSPVLQPPDPLPPLRDRFARGDAVPMLLFAAGGERFLLPLSDVREAVDAPVVESVPRMIGATRGVMALRGALLPVKDPTAALGVPAAHSHAALVVRGECQLVLLIDDVLDAVTLTASAIRPVPGALGLDDFVLGATPVTDGLATVLDLPPLLLALDLSDR
jgi:chemotaxis signal transduction protein